MIRIGRRLTIAMLSLSALSLARAQHPTQDANDLPSQLSLAARQTIVHLADSLRSVHLPDRPLYDKAAEGVLKGAEDTRIVTAVRTLARELGEARSALGDGAEAADLVAAASALHVGATPAMLSQLRDTQRAAGGTAVSLATPLVALADLLSRHVPAPAAASAIGALVARRAPNDDFAALRAGVERDIDAGRTPETAVTQRAQSIIKSIDARGRP